MSQRKGILVVLGWIGVVASPGHAISVEELRMLRDRGERVVIVDVRSTAEFEAGHVQGAIHVPARVIPRKRLPPFGRVIVVGDGIDVATAEAAAGALNEKTGIRAEVLRGGYLAWSGAGGSGSRAPGLYGPGVPHIGYAHLARAAVENPDLVLVDLRMGESRTPLGALFPGVSVISPPEAARRSDTDGELRLRSLFADAGPTGASLYVLIDDGDGRTAEPVARRLGGAGFGRVAILAGGEQALQSRGQAREETRTLGTGTP